MTDQSDPNLNFREQTRSTREIQPSTRIILVPIGLIITVICTMIRLLGGMTAGERSSQKTYSESNARLLNSGVMYYNDGDYEKAIIHFNLVIASQPDYGEAYNNLGLAYFAQGENNKAIVEFDNAIQLMPNPATPYSNRGAVYLSMGDYEHALADFDKAVELDPRLAKAYYNRGSANIDLGRYEQAIADFGKAIELTPEQIALIQVAMQTRVPQGENSLTWGLMNDLESAQSYADLPTAYAYRAIAYAQTGDLDQATADLSKASELGLDPETVQQIEALVAVPGLELQPEQGEGPASETSSPGNGSGAPWGEVWTSYGLEGRSVNAIAVNPGVPSTLFAGTDGGLFKSTDAGSSWSLTSLPADAVSSLAIDPLTPSSLYAGTDSGLFKTIDGGENWSPLGLDAIHILAIDPLSPETIYAGTYRGVFKSTEGGQGWGAVNNGLDNSPPGSQMIPVMALAIDPQTPGIVYAGTMTFTYPGTSRSSMSGLFKTTNGGETWSKLFDGGYTSFSVLAIDPWTPAVLYAASGAGVYKSTDAGQSWGAINAGLACATANALAIDPNLPSTLYLGTICGLFKSTDAGQSWTGLDAGLTNSAEVLSLAIDPWTGSSLYAGTRTGLVLIQQEDIR